MGKLDKILDTLPQDLREKLDAAVEEGRYETRGEILLDALYLWHDQESLREVKLANLKAMIAEARSGPYYPAEQVFAELRERAAAHAAGAVRPE